MHIEEKSLSSEDIAFLTENCIWMMLPKESSDFFTQLDWKMCGGMSRAVKKMGDETHVILPTLKRVPSEYVILEKKFDPDFFVKTCEGMKLRAVAMVCESESDKKTLQTKLKSLPKSSHLQTVVLYRKESGTA